MAGQASKWVRRLGEQGERAGMGSVELRTGSPIGLELKFKVEPCFPKHHERVQSYGWSKVVFSLDTGFVFGRSERQAVPQTGISLA